MSETDDIVASRDDSVPKQLSKDRNETESTPHNSSRIPNRDDLKHILHLRGRLQAIGCLFDADGEIQGFGHPSSEEEIGTMLRLGALYDRKWSLFFDRPLSSDIGPDICVLKRVLENEGVLFNDRHKRLAYGDCHPELQRLCGWYDVLMEEWMIKTMENVHPALRERRSFENGNEEQSLADQTQSVSGGKWSEQDCREHRSHTLVPVMEGNTNAYREPELPVEKSNTPPRSPPAILHSEPPHTLTPPTRPRTRPRPFMLEATSPLLHGPGTLQIAGTASIYLQNPEPPVRGG